MRRLALLTAGLCLCLAVLAVSGICRAQADKGKADKELAALIEQLGDDDFDVRETAGKKIEALGTSAVPALADAAANSTDLEIRRRANRLIRVLMPAKTKSKSIGLEMVRIDAGEFEMGSPARETNRKPDEAVHLVRVSRPFYLGVYEVTQEEYSQVMKATPSWFSAGGPGKDRVKAVKTERFPVDRVSWYDAVEFCNALSKKDGFAPFYKVTDVKREDGAIVSASVRPVGGTGYRLPTEAEWEYACRAGTKSPWHFGTETKAGDLNCKPLLSSFGYGSSYKWPDLSRPARVGSSRPNIWGLHDMHGNVAEWCDDWYDKDYYANSPRLDPKGPAKGQHRVLRGGSWLVTEGSCRSATRAAHSPDECKYYAGFRVARSP